MFLHGAGMDHSVWALQSRWFAHHGFSVLAVDLPGHGGSAGPPLRRHRRARRLDGGADRCAGRQGERSSAIRMGALIALATAARYPRAVAAIALVGVGAKMPVHPDLLAAAKAGRSRRRRHGLALGPRRACDAAAATRRRDYGCSAASKVCSSAPRRACSTPISPPATPMRGRTDAAAVACPASLVLGERDMMTPPKSGLALAEAIAGRALLGLVGHRASADVRVAARR